MVLKAWHIYGLILIPVALLLIGVAYGAVERDGTERTERALAPEMEATPPAEETPRGPPPAEKGQDDQLPSEPDVTLVAEGIEFDQAELKVLAGSELVIRLENQDEGILHNVSIRNEEGDLFEGEIFAGVDSRDYQVPAVPAGEYEFLCIVHPQQMQGTLLAE